MKKTDHILLYLKNKFSLKTDKDVAKLLGINYNTFKNWGIRDSPNYSLLIKFAQDNNIDLNEFLGNNEPILNNNSEISGHLNNQINLLNKSEQDLLSLVIFEANDSGRLNIFNESLVNFYLNSKFKDDFMVESGQKKFWKELIFADKNKIAFTLLLGKILENFQVNIDTLTEVESKEILIKLVEKYRLKLFQDQLKHGLIKKEKDALLEWIKAELSDFDAYVILKNVPSVLNVFRRSINSLNAEAF